MMQNTETGRSRPETDPQGAPHLEAATNALETIEHTEPVGGVDGAVAEFIIDSNKIPINPDKAVIADETGELLILAGIEPTNTAITLATQPEGPLLESLGELNEAEPTGEAVKYIVSKMDEALAQASLVEASANYQGNWTEAQHARMASGDFMQKLQHWIDIGAASLPKERTGLLFKGRTAAEYATFGSHFKVALEEVYSRVDYVEAESIGKEPKALGTSPGFGKPGIVFRDARQESDEIGPSRVASDISETIWADLTDAQKDIIAAHEIYHSLVIPEGEFALAVKRGFDSARVSAANTQSRDKGSAERTPPSYMNAMELTARMAQIKNYFGMQNAEEFTSAHLAYAKEHYVTDTGLDNNMTVFFSMITEETEPDFIANMNSMPI